MPKIARLESALRRPLLDRRENLSFADLAGPADLGGPTRRVADRADGAGVQRAGNGAAPPAKVFSREQPFAAEPHTRVYLDLGYLGEDLHDRTNAPAPLRTSAFTDGIGFRY
jgi:hypothetical protein